MLIGRGEKIRTSDPHNPIVVRYQAALRPDRTLCCGCKATLAQGGNHTPRAKTWKDRILAAQNLKNLFKFHSYLLDYLLTLSDIRLGVIARKPLSRSTNRESLVIQEAPDLSNDQYVLTLVIAAIASTLYGLQLWELLLPIPEYVRLDRTKIAYFTNRKVTLTRNWR